MGFILFALFFYLIYFLVKYLFIKPFKQGYAAHGRRPRNNWYNSSNTFNRREGEVTISYSPEQKRGGGKVGEYVDYEEVND